MRAFFYIFKIVFIFILLLPLALKARVKTDTTKFFKRMLLDTSMKKMNMDAIYNRPFLTPGKLPIAIGGYLEANTQFSQTNGINEGLSFQARRFTMFLSSTIARKIKFLAELEFEEGTKEINLEFSAMDIEFHPLLNLRGGIIMNPIGAFNQNHDGPRWDFIDRPIEATTIIPSTLSNVGFGLYGKYFLHNWILGYESYLTNGFDDKIIDNKGSRTSLAAGKSNLGKFEESNSGIPMFTGKIAIRNRKIGEFGISYMTGVYNHWQEDGLILDRKRYASVLSLDFTTSFIKKRINIKGEVAKVFVDIPETYTQQYGTQQIGAYIDIVGTVLQRKMMDWKKAKLNLGVRLEYVDYNQGEFKETGGQIADDIWAIVPSIAFRPVGTTVVRLNYRYEQRRDFLGNLPALTGVIQLGISTYF